MVLTLSFPLFHVIIFFPCPFLSRSSSLFHFSTEVLTPSLDFPFLSYSRFSIPNTISVFLTSSQASFSPLSQPPHIFSFLPPLLQPSPLCPNLPQLIPNSLTLLYRPSFPFLLTCFPSSSFSLWLSVPSFHKLTHAYIPSPIPDIPSQLPRPFFLPLLHPFNLVLPIPALPKLFPLPAQFVFPL